MKFLCGLLLLSVALCQGEPTDFIRIDEDATHAHLQTSLTSYTRGGQTVTLIGAVHIGDAEYYQALNVEFTRHEALLFELIGGEDAAKHLNGKPRPAEEVDGRPAEGLRDLYASFANTMQLSQQMDLVDYTPKNFVHADLTAAEYAAVTAEKGEDLLAFTLESSINTAKVTEKPFGGMNMGLVMRAILSGDGSGLKLEYMKMMDQGDESAAALTGENIVIGDRNAKCMQVLARELATEKKTFGIFYGAAHFPDLEKRLVALGFEKDEHQWLTAWKVAKPAQ